MSEQNLDRTLVAELFREVALSRASHRVTHAAAARRQARAAERQARAEGEGR